PQTIGVEQPRPGIFSFQAMFFLSSHSVARFFSELTPSLLGPRHCGQFSAWSNGRTARSRAEADRYLSMARPRVRDLSAVFYRRDGRRRVLFDPRPPGKRTSPGRSTGACRVTPRSRRYFLSFCFALGAAFFPTTTLAVPMTFFSSAMTFLASSTEAKP